MAGNEHSDPTLATSPTAATWPRDKRDHEPDFPSKVVSLPERHRTGDHPSRSNTRPTDPGSEATDPANWRETLIPQGNYQVSFVRERRAKRFNRIVWLAEFAIVDLGEHHGKRLLLPLNALAERTNPTRGHAVVQAWAVATDRKPPRDLARRPPSWFLANCVFLAEVRTVTRSSQGKELPKALHYSRIQRLISREAGTPPCLDSKR